MSESDPKFEYIKDRIGSAFPKLQGAKLDKLLTSDEAKYVFHIF
jgi:hypothetical protein